MKLLLVLLFLSSSSLYAGDDCVDCGNKLTGMIGSDMDIVSRAVSRGKLIENDLSICGPVRRNSFKDLVANLKKYYNTTLEESYFRIKCSGKDILGMVVESPVNRFFVGRGLRKYFEKKIDRPEIFSQILINKQNARDIVSRIDYKLKRIKGSEVESRYNKKLYYMRRKYIAYLKKYPIKPELFIDNPSD